MEKINFINGQAPAINATNLNQLQTNVEKAIDDKTQIASETVLGLIKKGSGIVIDENGVASIDLSALVEDITDNNVITYSSDITLSSEGQNKVYKILDKFIYFTCVGSKATSTTSINVGTVAEKYRPSGRVYSGGVGGGSQHLSVNVNSEGAITTTTPSSNSWFGITLIWAIK